MNLVQLSRLNGSQRGEACVLHALQHSKLLNVVNSLNAFELTENKWRFTPIKPQTQKLLSRKIGTDYKATDGHSLINGSDAPLDLYTIDDVTGTLYIHGHYIDVDASIIADASHSGVSMTDWMIKQLKAEFKKFYNLYDPVLLNGNGTSELKGLRNIIKWGDKLAADYGTIEGYRESTYNRVMNAAAYSTDATPKKFDFSIKSVGIDKQQRAFIEMMDNAISDVENPNVIFMHKKLKARIWSGLKTSNNFAIDENTFGTAISTYNKIPIIELNDNIMPINEPDDTATPLNDTTSIYVLSLGEQNLSLATNSGVEYNEHSNLEAKEAGREKWEIRAGWKCENPYAIKVIRNIYLG